MQTLSKNEMKILVGGVAQTLVVTGWTRYGNSCTVDTCYIDTNTGAVSNCHCDQPTECASWMY